ncbi:MAG: fibronectin type III domain-containing protein [Methyloglobulus sp.]|nr:hypothetical protein [Methyloglobulus sp.]
MNPKKNNIKSRGLLSLTLGLTMAAGCGGQVFAVTTSYTVTDFTAVGAGGFVPSAINSNGQVLGRSGTLATINNAQIYTPQLYDIASGTVTNIDALANGDIFASASAINAKRQAIGQVLPATSTTGVSTNVFVRNADGSLIDLGMSPGSTAFSAGVGVGINDAGQVFGNKSGTSLCSWRAFAGDINGGGLVSLGSIGGGAYDWTQATAMNSKGEIVGRSSPSGACLLTDTWHAFISTPTGLKDLQSPAMPVINSGSGGSTARGINDFGFVVGEYPYAFATATRVYPAGAPIMHGVIWDAAAGTYSDLGKLNFRSSLFGINASGLAVGYEASTTAGAVAYAVIGDIASGSLTDLNSLATGLPTGWTLTSAYNISDAGQILATAVDAANVAHYALLTPSTTPPPPAVPLAPSSLAAVVVSATQINLSWVDNATNETAQTIERCAGIACTNFAPIATLAADVTTYQDTALAAGTRYRYRVVASNATGDSAYSNIAAVTTNAAPLATPAAPSALSASAITRNTIALNWLDNSDNEVGFLIERCKGLNCTSFSKIASVGANVVSYTNTGLSRNTNYGYRVRATNAVGKSTYSNILRVKTLP